VVRLSVVSVPTVKWDLKILYGKFWKKHLLSFKFHAIMSTVRKSCAIPFLPALDVNCYFVSRSVLNIPSTWKSHNNSAFGSTVTRGARVQVTGILVTNGPYLVNNGQFGECQTLLACKKVKVLYLIQRGQKLQAEVAHCKNSSIRDIMKEQKETCASFTVPPQTAKVIATVKVLWEREGGDHTYVSFCHSVSL
jgi:hypothetical protein